MKSDEIRDKYTQLMVRHLPTLRRSLRLTQTDLSKLLGVTRGTVTNIENGRTPLSWCMFIALLGIFKNDREALEMMKVFGIVTPELDALMLSIVKKEK